MTKDQHQAQTLTSLYWEGQRAQVISWLVRDRGFAPRAAELAAKNFINTMVFVAGETGELMFKCVH